MRLRFEDLLTECPKTDGMDARTTLRHFAIVSYLVDPKKLASELPPRFVPDVVTLDSGESASLVSIVPFLDVDFRFLGVPWATWRFGQTNYRAYVTDTETNEHVVWFFGTTLASWTVWVPRYVWKLPWHKARTRFETEYDSSAARYLRYRVRTRCSWGPLDLELHDSGSPPNPLPGFSDLETGLALLTHPLRGHYRRRDRTFGTYEVWHPRLNPTTGTAVTHCETLFHRLGLVEPGQDAHSVLIQPETEFTIFLPPRGSR